MEEKRTAGGQGAVAIVAAADFESAFRAHFAPVYRFIARRVGADLAEDLAAEVFATAYRRRGSYEPSRGSLRSWLYGIAANLVRGHWRDEQQLLELDARLGAPGPEAAFADAADDRGIAAALAPRIAAALGIARGTARSRLSRARAALRAHLGEFDFNLWTFKESDHA